MILIRYRTLDEEEGDRLVEERTFMWSWPFCTDGMAHGAYTREKFLVCLPFNKGGTGEKNGTVSLHVIRNEIAPFYPFRS
ncbi:hypothetical protein COOONC_18175, partial [Cooperia oncophora]